MIPAAGNYLSYRRWATLLAMCAGLLGCGVVVAEEVSFSRDVKPILARRCFACHGPETSESGFALHERQLAIAATNSGSPAIVPGDPEASELLSRVLSHDTDLRMPPEGDPLSEREVGLLRRWIAAGAEYQKHWAFVPPKQQTPPQVLAEQWIANPIDRFVLAQLEAAGLQPNPPADKRVLARRVYYDLTGLPPSPQELSEYLADDRPDAYERLVDRLLASPRHGEKWARHWLDLVRYGESNSFERDAPKPFVWKYRDYVIRSLNNDKPYDQFVREQLAGDELDTVTADSITATGFYRLGTWDDEPADPLQAKFDDLDNTVATTSGAFLGLTIGCARCHDHKIDPVPQTDYYSFLAFFADVTPYALKDRRDPKFHSLWDFSDPDIKQRRETLQRQIQSLGDEQRAIEQAAIKQMEAADQRRTETRERQAVLDEKLHRHHSEQAHQQYLALKQQSSDLESQLKSLPPPELILSLAKCDARPATMHVMHRGNPHAPGEAVAPAFPELFGADAPQIPPTAPGARSAGRRRVLAEWITRDDNMLSSRVIANRLWQHHFGRGIVRTPNNFGQLGTPPTHPALLDWLAVWLVDNDWRLKPLHKLMVMSSAYRQSSAATPEGLAADPENNLFWRFDMRRLTAEEIRDSVLFTSGKLNLQMHGPSIYPKLSQEVLATQSRPGENWGKSSSRQAARRSIYIHIKRSLLPPELSQFDFPEPDISCEARFNTTQAAQALNMLHGEFLQTQAGHFAHRVRQEAGDQSLRNQLGYAMRLALQRAPNEQDLQDAEQLIEKYRTKHSLSEEEAFRQYCLLVLNLNEFVYLD